jgi:hypothetical protein
MAEKENLDEGRLVEPYAGFGIRSITKSEGLAALWRGWKVAWIQTTLGHMSNIPLFFGWMPFRVLNEAGIVKDPYLHGVLYALICDLLLYPIELAHLCIVGDVLVAEHSEEKEEQEKEDQASSLSSAKSSEPVTSAQVAKKGYLFNGLWDFLERTIAAQGWRGLWNGYSFTFSRLIMRAAAHFVIALPMFQNNQGVAIGLNLFVGVLTHCSHVIHARYVLRNRVGTSGPAYRGVANCIQSVVNEGPRSVFAGIGFAVVAAFLDQVTQGIFEGVSEGFAQVVQGSPESASQ